MLYTKLCYTLLLARGERNFWPKTWRSPRSLRTNCSCRRRPSPRCGCPATTINEQHYKTRICLHRMEMNWDEGKTGRGCNKGGLGQSDSSSVRDSFRSNLSKGCTLRAASSPVFPTWGRALQAVSIMFNSRAMPLVLQTSKRAISLRWGELFRSSDRGCPSSPQAPSRHSFRPVVQPLKVELCS